MVLAHKMEDLLEVSSKFTSFSLPSFKESRLTISFKEPGHCNTLYQVKEPLLPFAASEVFEATILSWKNLTSYDNDDSKRIYEVTFDVNGSNFKFQPGDTIGVLPQNHLDEVDGILKHLGLHNVADCPYNITVDDTIKGAKIPVYVPVESSLRHVFTHNLDLRGVIKKLFLLALSKHTKNEDERKVLEYLSSKEGSTTYSNHILSKNLSILDLFKTFPSCLPPVEVLLSHLPRLLPRPYSIVNSQLANKDVLKICFSVINIAQNKKGLTTGYLEEVLLNGDSIENGLKNLSISGSKYRVSMYLRKNMNGFWMPKIETPLILIGPGTGVAPFIGFLEERSILKRQNLTLNLGKTWLFFGCRNNTHHIYKKELESFVEDGILTKLSTAFSRIDNEQYVQDAIQKDGEKVIQFIENGASIFVCGDLKNMAVQVRDTLKQCFVKYRYKSENEAKDYISQLEEGKRYLVDIWS